MNQLVLDLDLDFFLDKINHSRWFNTRLRNTKFNPWSEEKVRYFLEEQCGLSKESRVLGRFYEQHDGAFFFWRELIEKNQLQVPFELIRVDAHADFGRGDKSWKYIMGELLHLPVKERMYPKVGFRSGLNLANYMAFAVACRWFSKITFVIHPKWQYDLVAMYYKDYYVPTGCLQLKKYDKKQLNRKFKKKFYETTPLGLEPVIVPLERVRLHKFKNDNQFSFMFLFSPSF